MSYKAILNLKRSTIMVNWKIITNQNQKKIKKETKRNKKIEVKAEVSRNI